MHSAKKFVASLSFLKCQEAVVFGKYRTNELYLFTFQSDAMLPP